MIFLIREALIFNIEKYENVRRDSLSTLEMYRKGCPCFFCAFYSYFSVVVFYNAFGYGKTKTVAALLPHSGFVRSIEALKYMGYIFLRDSHSRIIQFKTDPVLALGEGSGYRTLISCEIGRAHV